MTKVKLSKIVDGEVSEELEATYDRILTASKRGGGSGSLSPEMMALIAELKETLPSEGEIAARIEEAADVKAKAYQAKVDADAEAEAEKQRILVEGQGPEAPDAQGPKVDPPAE